MKRTIGGVLVCALLAWSAWANAADRSSIERMSEGDGPPINLTCIGMTVPAAVHVSALVPHADDLPVARTPRAALPAKDTDLAPQSHSYMWDFGDPEGRYNQLPGWNAAHVYDKPGKFIIKLTVTDDRGKVTHRTTWVRVAADNRRKVYCSLQGNDEMNGASPALAVRSAGRAIQIGRADADILFRRGDAFPVAHAIDFEGHNTRIGAYDDPAFPATTPPVLRKVEGPPKQDIILSMSVKSTEVFIDGIEFDSMFDLKQFGPDKVKARGISAAGINCCIRDCSFRNVTDAVNSELRPTGLFVLDCKFSNEVRGYGIWGNGSDHVYVGNIMLHSRQEHLIRIAEPGVTRLLIAYNDLYRPNNGKGSIELRNANWFYVSDNLLSGGTLRIGPQEQDQHQYPNWASIKCDWGVVQNNRLENVFINIRLGTEHVAFRNNFIHLEGKEDGDWAFFVACLKPGFDTLRKVVDVQIEHNTAVNDGNIGQFLVEQGHAMGLTLKDNLFIAPNLRRTGDHGHSVFAFDKDLSGFKQIEGNVWPAGAGGVFHWDKADHSPDEWARQPIVSRERYENVVLDADGNAPHALNAGARLPSKPAPKHAPGPGPWDELPRRDGNPPGPSAPRHPAGVTGS